MKIFFVLSLLAVSAFALSALNEPVLDQDIVDEVNDPSMASGWTAAMNSRFEGMTVAQARGMCGTLLRREGESDLPSLMHPDHLFASLPATFDARKQWGSCVHPILNQAQCGSCWAFGASEALSDRFCIKSKNQTNVVLSPQDLVSCDKTNYGCQGGYLDAAWDFMRDTGLVSIQCMPYTSGGGQVAACPQGSCTGSGSWKPYKASSVYDVSNSAANIQQEIYENGPVEAAFSVYQDFMHYSSGVYKHTSGSLLGGHAIKVLGWGVENGEDYWLVANSWGTSWGLSGFFKILRGVNECGIESNVVAGEPSL